MTDFSVEFLRAGRMQETPLIEALVGALETAEERLSEVIQDDPDATMFRAARKEVRAAIRKGRKRLTERL